MHRNIPRFRTAKCKFQTTVQAVENGQTDHQNYRTNQAKVKFISWSFKIYYATSKFSIPSAGSWLNKQLENIRLRDAAFSFFLAFFIPKTNLPDGSTNFSSKDKI